MTSDTDPRLERLFHLLDELGSTVVASSGGVDSSFLLWAAHARSRMNGHRVIGVLGRSASVAERELADARTIAERSGAELRIIETGEFDDPRYLANPTDRCFYCKDDLYRRLAEVARSEGFATVADGANADDLGDHRPGMEAARRHGVRSPLLEARLTKNDIRELSEAAGLPTWDKPAAPCLSSRLPYGEAITPEKLKRVELAERVVRECGFPVARVRAHGDLARIEVPAEMLERLATGPVRQEVSRRLHELGYAYVAIDVDGFHSGSLNRELG